MIASHIIKNTKRTDTGEIIVTLFELCNLNCLFCNQDHTSTLGIDTVLSKIDSIKRSINELRTNTDKTSFSINIMGGEILADELPDSVFDDYIELTRMVKEYAVEIDVVVDIRFVTNFVWSKKERVYRLLKETGSVLGTSYDPAGRFNKETFQVFQDNVTEFADHIQGVNVILTKANIDRFLKDQVPFFDFLYANFEIYFDHYTPESNLNFLLPKDVDLRDIAIYLIDHYPNVYPYRFYKDKKKNNMTCMDTLTILPSNTYGKCDILLTSSLPDKAIPIKFIPTTKRDMEQKWFEDYNCLECDQLYRCSLGCFLSNHIKDGRTQEACWMKEVYDYVDSKTH